MKLTNDIISAVSNYLLFSTEETTPIQTSSSQVGDALAGK